MENHYRVKYHEGCLNDSTAHMARFDIQERLTRWRAYISGSSVVVEDVTEVACTIYIEFLCKPAALVVDAGISGISVLALFSLLCALANASFKVVEAVRRARTGLLDLISPGSPAIRLTALPARERAAVIRKLAPPELHTRHLDLRGNGLDDTWASSFAERVLRNMPKVENLDLDGNQIGDAGVTKIAIALEHCPNLKELRLGTNEVGDMGAAELAKSFSLGHCPNLEA
jgi:hypothetical protein